MAEKTDRSWESRLSGSPDRQMMAFVESLSVDRRLAPYDIQGSVAHARMLACQGLLCADELQAIEAGLAEIGRQIRAGQFPFDTAQEDIHMAIESALISRIGEPGRKLHTGRSRNDQVATDLRLWMRDQIRSLRSKITALQGAIVDLASRHVQDVMPAYTHMQRAQPVSIGAYCVSLVEPLERDYLRLGHCLDLLDCSPLGSGAIAGSTLPIDRDRTARDLGFAGFSRSSIDAVGDRDFAVEYVFDCAMVASHLSRLAEDWILFCSAEFGFLRIDDAFCTSSSMMPQKRNPDALELIRGKTASVYGSLMAMLTLLKALPSGYNRDLQEDKVHVFACTDTVEACLDMAAAVAAHARFLPERIAEDLDQGFLDATALAEYLVRKGLAFRQAHGVVGSLVAVCEKEGKRLQDLTLDRFRSAWARIDQDVYEILGPAHVAKAYRTQGAAGVGQAAVQIAFWKEHLASRGPGSEGARS
ncbi:MAG: argininosuccinate lyase [Phycisphaerae bacterium]|nr:argininosuccinate lyase [Phycisphaerae bacterium]